MKTNASLCRWGIISTANIARKNWLAIKNSGNGVIAAVASRRLVNSQLFIDECQSNEPFETAPLAIEGYDELLQRPDIDAVYIPLPTGLRKKWVIAAAESGKHIVCEKPCAANATDLKAMLDACHTNGVQFMDGVMYMHTKRLAQMRAVLDDGISVGKVRRIASQFSFKGGSDFEAENIRLNSTLEPLGALGDLGWYTIRFSLWAMKFALPKYVTGTMLHGQQRADSPLPVPMEFKGDLFFNDGVSASFYNSFITEHQQWASISGTNGHLHLADFVLPYHGGQTHFQVTNSQHQIDGCKFRMFENTTDHTLEEASDSTIDSQEANLFRNFAELIKSGRLEPLWPEIALKTQRVMDAVLESANSGGSRVNIG